MKTAFFQSFEDTSEREKTPFRLSMVQAELKKIICRATSFLVLTYTKGNMLQHVMRDCHGLQVLQVQLEYASLEKTGQEYLWTAATVSRLKSKQNHHLKLSIGIKRIFFNGLRKIS